MATASQTFALLHEQIQRWIWEQGWTELRLAQEQAIAPILAANTDLLIAAPTANGKTEAAFFPALSAIADNADAGIRILYVSPLKALINDQYRRLQELTKRLHITVTIWHGDSSQARKRALLKQPRGVLLITPESLEAMLINHGQHLTQLFGKLAYVVLDELHAFIDTERGQQLQSLLQRLELLIGHQVPRIGLSATLSQLDIVTSFMRPGNSFPCQVIDVAGQQSLKIQVRGYIFEPPQLDSTTSQTTTVNVDDDSAANEDNAHDLGTVHDGDVLQEQDDPTTATTNSTQQIARDLYRILRGDSHLVFANTKHGVEVYADKLRCLAEQAHVPNEFFPHHGSLSKELREDLEARLQQQNLPTTAICTTTLEMGIDIGQVTSVAQIGPPPSVASLRQRLGRSGRRGQAATLRVFITQQRLQPTGNLLDQLRCDLVQTIAMIELLLQRWYEPPVLGQLHLSTLIHQVLALIAQLGGVSANQALQTLCGTTAPFNLKPQQFALLLRHLGACGLIQQDHDGILVLAEAGERLVNHYSFYAVFFTPEEFRIVHGDRTLGQIPVNAPIRTGCFIIFAGRRWLVLNVDIGRRLVEVSPAKGGRTLSFGSKTTQITDRVRQEMRAIYLNNYIPSYLDTTAKGLLQEARYNFQMLELHKRCLLQQGQDIWLLPWRGDRILNTIAIGLVAAGFKVGQDHAGIFIPKVSKSKVLTTLQTLATQPLDLVKLAQAVPNKIIAKYDEYLPTALLDINYAAWAFDADGALAALQGEDWAA